MALEELLSLITGGLKGYSQKRDAEQRRQQYQQEQAFKQWQVMSDLEGKADQRELMRENYRLQAEARDERNRLMGLNYGNTDFYRRGLLANQGLGLFTRALPNVQTQAGLDYLGRTFNRPVDGLSAGDFRAPSQVVGMRRADITDRHLGIVDRNAIIARVMASSDPAAAEADANAQLIAAGLPPISGRLPQSAAASAAMTNAATGDRNSRFNTDPLGLGGAKIEATRAGAAVNRGLAGLFPLKSKALEADIANTAADTLYKKANTKYITMQTGNMDFDNQIDAQKLALERIDQRWKTDPSNPQNLKVYMDFAAAQRAAATQMRLELRSMVPLDYNRNPIPRAKWTPELDARYTQSEIMLKNLEGLAKQAETQFKNYMARNGMAPDGSMLVDTDTKRTVPPPTRYNADTYPPAPGYKPVPGSLPNPGAVGGQARAAGAKAGFKPQPIKKSTKTPAEKAGVGVKMRKPQAKSEVDKNIEKLMGLGAGAVTTPRTGKVKL